ncbi:Unknown protein [Striga hermonthica]|uniref:DDE Tnp4 domain-containing protein n=1 Tax=Striga hermonthica TaxID=68872 RepID=A0A9N7MS27_STRHE|nr:Unknown protein [Striga hermonthica]
MFYVDDSDTYEEEIDDLPEDVDSEFETVEEHDPFEASLMMGAQFQQLVNIYESSASVFPPLRRIPYRESTYSSLDWGIKGNDLQLKHSENQERQTALVQLTGLLYLRGCQKDNMVPRCRKGYLAQNMMLACDFDLKFTFVLAGWEGRANDARIFNQTLSDPRYNFPYPPPGKFYVVDSGYAHIPGFMTPYRGERYHLPEWLGSNQLPGNARELFNRRHATVRNVIECSFGLLKGKFPMIKGLMPNYKVHSQTDIVIACCVLHNFIRMHELLENMPPEFSNPEYVRRHDPTDRTFPFMSSNNSNVGGGEHYVLRDSIAQTLWANEDKNIGRFRSYLVGSQEPEGL